MTVPQTHLDAIDAVAVSLGRWLEIEGIPYAFGNFTVSNPSVFFSGRNVQDRPLGIKPYFTQDIVPRMLDQQIDTLAGGATTKGSVDFTLSDIDGSVAALTSMTAGATYVLDEELAASDGDITLTDTTGLVNGQVIHIGTEAIKIGTVASSTSLTGCTRGYYRSKALAFGIGIPVGTQPYTMANRRCWYNQVAVAGQGRQNLAIDHGGDDNACVRFSGRVDNMKRGKNALEWVITAQTMDAELDQKVFRDLRSHQMQEMIMSDRPHDDKTEEGAGTIQVAGYDGFGANIFGVGNDRSFPPPLNTQGLPLYASGERALVRIDDEIFAILGLSNGQLQFQQRALLGTRPVKHQYGAVMQEVVCVMEYENTFSVQQTSKFMGPLTFGAHGDHPLAIVLQLLLSTGTGNNDGGTDEVYDVLPEGWGLGIDAVRVDVVGIERAMREEPTLRFGGIIEKPTNFLALIREILSFAGYYYYVEIGDLFKIKRLRPPTPDETDVVRVIDDSVRIRNAGPQWEGNWSGAIREVVYKYAWDILRSQYKVIDIYKLAAGDLYSKGKARTLEYVSQILYPGSSGIPGEPPFKRFDIHAWLQSRAEFFKVRYGRPPPIVHERLTYRFIDIEVGDLAFVSGASLPSTFTGVLGMDEEIGEVIAKSVDDKTYTVNVTLLMTGWQIGNYRFISPTCEIASIDAAPSASTKDITVHANRFTDGSNSSHDMAPVTVNGDQPLSFSDQPETVWLWKADLSDHIVVSILAYNIAANTFRIETEGAIAWPVGYPAVGQFLTLADSSLFVDPDPAPGPTDPEVGEDLGLKYAFAAGADNLITGILSDIFGTIYFPT